MAKVSTGHAESGEKQSGELLKKAARAIGSAVGIAASKTGLAHSTAAHGPRIVAGKFQKSHKRRLPRKLKKVGVKGTPHDSKAQS